MSCTCQECGNKYKVDFLVTDELWFRIMPNHKNGSGLLCGSCICKKIEALDKYDVFFINKIDNKKYNRFIKNF